VLHQLLELIGIIDVYDVDISPEKLVEINEVIVVPDLKPA